MYTKLWFWLLLLLLVAFLGRITTSYLNSWYQTLSETSDNKKVGISYQWQNIFKNKPVLTLLAMCECPDGKGGIDLNCYNPEDIDGKEKFGPLQFDKETFYSEAKIYNIKNSDINNPVQQILLAEKMISDGKWYKWGCWFKLFPR